MENKGFFQKVGILVDDTLNTIIKSEITQDTIKIVKDATQNKEVQKFVENTKHTAKHVLYYFKSAIDKLNKKD